MTRLHFHLGSHGFIVRRDVYADIAPDGLQNIDGVLVDLPGPVNPRLLSVKLRPGQVVVTTTLGSAAFQIPQKGKFIMNRWFSIISHALLMSGQVFNVVAPVIPGKAQGIVAGVLALAQGVLGVVAHAFNVDGTPSPETSAPKVQ